MASMGDLTVRIEIEPVVKLICLETTCVYNMYNMHFIGYAHCNLKVLTIKEGGRCAMFTVAQTDTEVKEP